MRKRQKAPREEKFIDDSDLNLRPPHAPPDYVPPSPAEVLQRLNNIGKSLNPTTTPSFIPPPPTNVFAFNSNQTDSPKLDILSRLKAISQGESLPVPTSKPTIEIVPKVGIELDDLNQIEAPKPTNSKLATLTALKPLEASDESPEPQGPDNSVFHYDRPIGFGIGPTLEFIIHNGIMIEHKGEDEQVLEYRDSSGHLINGKAAFKHQSHVFSGKAPGLKYRLKRLEKIKAEEKKKTFQIGDTPLHTASSLRHTLEEKKQAFIELTGEQRDVLPYEPVKEQEKNTKTRKKRLKLRSKMENAKELQVHKVR
ncbi:U4/U6.U5 tri-snRNP-associated protein 1 [Histomonas meleagridis]|uniref:U4/U6.U5 tri-snRNP-associated protein 1 n=1 Tax=Histomonas meleagridis TaxID=135588 RepID=UPI00355A82B3|nr:U4/U6.U5 tri-snRNP-associated protein 1 [Histomonas meleagridis]KAH0804372.1 U4/U6.U5 tri-snRNP-associated protein 1 [Histomonas meleagridis]